jgi:TnpA family transposase
VAGQLGYLPGLITLETYDKSVQSRHRQLILEYLGFRAFDDHAQDEIIQDIRTMVRSRMRPKTILLRTLEILESRRIELPSAYTLTELIVAEAKRHQRDLTDVIALHLSAADKELLEALLAKPEATSAAQVQRFRLTLLKRIWQSTKPSKIKGTLEDWQTLRTLYERLAPLIHTLDLTHEGVQYYAHSVIKSEIFQVVRRAEEDRYLHLLCFIAHQFYRLQDTLIDILLTVVQHTLNTSQREHKEHYYAARQDHRQSLRTLVDCIDQGMMYPLTEIEAIAFCPDLSDADKVGRIQEVLTQGEVTRRAARERLIHVREQSCTSEDAGYYKVLAAKSVKLQNRAANIVKHLELEGDAPTPLLAAIEHYKRNGDVLDTSAPVGFLDDEEQQVIVEPSGKFQVSFYKALLFVNIANAIKAGTLNVKHSYKYRSLDDYLIPKEAWEKHRDLYLQRADLMEAADGPCTLQSLAVRLDQQYHHTNRRVLERYNPHLKVRKDGSFHVATPKGDMEEAEPLRTFLPERRYISLLEVLATVNRLTHFLDALTHWHVKYNRPIPQDRTFFAGIIGYGCSIGTSKIALISTGINPSELEHTINWYFSLDNIHAANDRLLHFMDELELPEIYRRQPGVLHTSSDGQKFEVAVDSLQATYSFKYFGQEQGVSACNFLDERHFLWHHTVISAAEREAAYVIDGLMHNDVVKSDIHSTDTAGYSEILFGTMHLLGFAFAPRMKNVGRQRLYALERRKTYEQHGYSILPEAYIQTPAIVEQWDDILRFVATIKLKETTASQLFRRLNSYAKQHPLYRALKEFGKILKSDFILRYFDDLPLRQAIEKQLNKGENANKFSRAVAFGNNQEFLHGDKVEQEIAEGCRRLIKNSIICWNYLYLTQKIAEEHSEEQRQTLLAAVRNGSVVTWQHINLHGEYDFSDEKLQDSVGLQATHTLALNLQHTGGVPLSH